MQQQIHRPISGANLDAVSDADHQQMRTFREERRPRTMCALAAPAEARSPPAPVALRRLREDWR